MKYKRIAITLVLCMLGALIVSMLPLRSDAAVFDQVVRLHVLAHSDSAEDQALKEKVRDEILPFTASLLADCRDAAHAEEILAASLDSLRECADRALEQMGSEQRASVTLCRERYPTRSYAGLRLPSGTYSSLQISLGEGEGKNWWCVLYPSLCLSSSLAENESAFLSAGFTPEQIRVLTDTENSGYVFRFRILEWIGSLFGGKD